MNINKPCKVCGKKGKLVCDKCQKVVYCSRNCQFNDWNVHKINCESKPKSLIITKKKFIKKNEPVVVKKKEKNNNKSNSLKKKSSSLLIEKKSKKRATLRFKKRKTEEIEQYEKLENFNFLEKFYNILFNKNQNVYPMFNADSSNFFTNTQSNKNLLRNEKNEKIKQIYSLLIEHRNFLITNILLDRVPNREKNFIFLNFMIDIYSRIENYILNFLLLIQFLFSFKDPLSLIKADQALKKLGEELFNNDAKNKQGLLIYSIDKIIKRFLKEENETKILNQSFKPIANVLKRFLSIISSIIKISSFLGDFNIYKKALAYYDKIFAIALKFLSINKETEITILKCNLGFNIANIFIKHKYINSAIQIYKNILQEQRTIEPCTFLCWTIYYNMSIIYFVMDKINESEFYINEGFEKINKLLDGKNAVRQIDAFRKLIRLFILFYAEINLEKQNYDEAAQCLKIIMENMIDDNKNLRGRRLSTISRTEFSDIKIIKRLKFKLRNYFKYLNSYANKNIFKLNRQESKLKDYKILSAFESLYEIQFYSSNSDKAIFDEKIKNYVNGFLNIIKAFYTDKEKKEKEKQKKIENLNLEKKNINNPTTNKTENNNIGNKIIEETEKNLPELNLTNIIKINSNEIANNTINLTRGRNKTISKRVGKNFLKEKEKEQELENINKENIKINDNIYNKHENKIFLNEEISRKIISYINDKMIKKKKLLDNEQSISDLEYFFLLLTTLSYRQIEILNKTQPLNITDSKFRNLPILFSKQFKNSLNPSQKSFFDKLRVLSLIRGKILKEPKLPISIGNLNFSVFGLNINFDDFKIKYKNIPEIIETINRNEQEKKQKVNFGKFKKNQKTKKEILFSMFNGIKDKKDIIKNFIHHKLKIINGESSSEEEDNEISKKDYNDFEFKYQNKYDLNIIRNNLIMSINNKNSISYKSRELYIDIIKSNIFIQLMNCFDLAIIQELDKNWEILIDFLKFVRKVSLKEFKLYKHLKNNDRSQSDSSNISFSIEQIETNIFNVIKYSFDIKIYNRNISLDKLNLNKKCIPSDFYLVNNEKKYNKIYEYYKKRKIQRRAKSEDILTY